MYARGRPHRWERLRSRTLNFGVLRTLNAAIDFFERRVTGFWPVMRASSSAPTSTSFALLVAFFFQAEDGIRDADVTGVQTCALPISFPCWSGTGSWCAGAPPGSW